MADVVRIGLGILASLALAWVVFLVVLVVWRPRGMDLGEAKRLAPDIVRLVRALAGDDQVSPAARRRLGYLLAYLAFPIDLVPDFLPVVGYADDVVIIAVALRSVVRIAGPATIDRHWSGTPTGLAIVRSLAGLTES